MASGDTLVHFSPLNNEPTAASPATLDTRNQHPVLDFDTTLNEYGVFSAIMPQHYAGTTGITVHTHTAFSSATSGSATFAISFERIGEGVQDMDADGFATAACITIGAPATAGHVAASPLAFADGAAMDSIATGEGFRIKYQRVPADADDTATGDAELRFVEIRET